MLTPAVAWLESRRDARPWLLLGKGPSLDLRGLVDLGAYQTFALNHACRVHPCDVAHFTDLEALRDCVTLWQPPARAVCLPYVPHLCLPYVPHRDMGPGHYTLDELADTDPVLSCMRQQGRLLSYNSSRVPARRHHALLPLVRVRYFSAVAAVNLLALAGVKELFSLGVDGGTGYAQDFDTRHCLANGRASFTCQFAEIRRTCARHGLNYIPLAHTLTGG